MADGATETERRRERVGKWNRRKWKGTKIVDERGGFGIYWLEKEMICLGVERAAREGMGRDGINQRIGGRGTVEGRRSNETVNSWKKNAGE